VQHRTLVIPRLSTHNHVARQEPLVPLMPLWGY